MAILFDSATRFFLETQAIIRQPPLIQDIILDCGFDGRRIQNRWRR